MIVKVKKKDAYEKERYSTGFRYVFRNYLKLDKILRFETFFLFVSLYVDQKR